MSARNIDAAMDALRAKRDAARQLAECAPEMLAELKEIRAWAVKERAPLREQEIASIDRLIAKATAP